MIPTTTDPLWFPKQIVPMVLNAINEGNKFAAHMLWNALLAFVAQYWGWVILFLFISFSLATFNAMRGRWGDLGSFLYNFLYFGILFIIGYVRGPEVFLSDFYDVFVVIILYPFCYWLSGKIMKKMGVLRY